MYKIRPRMSSEKVWLLIVKSKASPTGCVQVASNQTGEKHEKPSLGQGCQRFSNNVGV